MVHVVRAQPVHLNVVMDLVNRLLAELGDGLDEFDRRDPVKTRGDLEACGDRFTAFLAQTDTGEAAGVVTVMEAFAIYAGGDYGIIDEMYVAPPYRSRGVGRQLIDAVKAHGRARGWLRLDVTAPPEPEWQRTVRFYEGQGFVFSGPKLRCMLD